ncbi:MAG: glycerophosphodiester phosphodiesterase [Acidimicrobiales bacterium]
MAIALASVALLAGCSDDGDNDVAATQVTTAPATTTTVATPVLPPAFGQDPQPVVIGHRGAAGHHPDNSLEGFAAARDLGATWVELDVRLSADGDVFLSHDPETDAGSVVATTPSAELAAEGLPTLSEALDVIDAHALGVDVEIKADPTEEAYDPSLGVVDATMAVLQDRAVTGPIVMSSFNRDAIDRVRELTEDAYDTALIAAGIGDAVELRDGLLETGHDGVVLDYEAADARTVHTLSTGGLTLWSYTVDNPTTAAALVADGVAGIVTDVPDAISEALGLLP